LVLLVVGCFVGGYVVVKRDMDKRVRESCLGRGGGERCDEGVFVDCARRNGVGFCEGVM
jgi:hypothetical protein